MNLSIKGYESNMLLTNKHFAFNVWDFESARAVIDAAASIKQDVIIQTSLSVYKRLPVKVFADFVKEYSSYKSIRTWLNIDHCKDKELLYSAIENGWDMVMADGSSLNIDQNISFTNEIVEYAHKYGVLVEAEIGQVKGDEDSLKIQQEFIASKTDISYFLSKTDSDFIAVAFGNVHGEYKSKPELRYDLIEYTKSITSKPFVVHGGSGLSENVLKKLISIDGVNKINISTDLKIAYCKAIDEISTNRMQVNEAVKIIHDRIMNVALSKLILIPGGNNN